MATCIRVLIWAELLASYAIWVLMTYLTDVWKLSLTHAAKIINIWGGIALILPVCFAYIVDTFLGNFLMLAVSSVAYSIGLVLLFMSTPPVLHKTTGTCRAYKPECIGLTQKALFYTSLVLLAIGIAGHIVSLKPSVIEQLQAKNPDVSGRSQNKERIKPRTVQSLRKRELLIALFSVIGGIALPYIKPWSIRFGIPAICTSVATIVFLSRSGLYIRKEAEVSPITEVEETKIPTPHIIKVMWITFIMGGVIFSAGNTYFQEQAKHLSTKVGKIKVPLPILKVGQEFAKVVFSSIYKCMRSSRKNKIRAPPIGILVAMIFSTLCCITAAKVEARRLNVIESHDLADKPDETIPMTIFWVLPQFLLLGGLEGFLDSSVTDLFHDQSPTSMARYFRHFTHGISGLGFLVSVLSVHVVGKISERGGRKNWFQDTLSKSRLDYYFWTLAALSAVNLILYVLMTTCYPCKRPPSDEAKCNNNGVLGEATNSVI